ncbi:chromatin-remodeling ATPase INO80-like [Styela clava]
MESPLDATQHEGKQFLQNGMAESVYVQGIKRALGVGELLNKIAKAAELKRQYLDQLRARIEERERNKLYIKDLDKKFTNPYGFKQTNSSRSWIKNIFEEEETSDDEDDVTEEDYREMLKLHRKKKVMKIKWENEPALAKYKYYSSDYVTNRDLWPSHRKNFKKHLIKKKKKSKVEQKQIITSGISNDVGRITNIKEEYCDADYKSPDSQMLLGKSDLTKKKKQPSIDTIRKRHWKLIAKKDIPKAYRVRMQLRSNNLALLRRVSRESMKRQRANAALSLKVSKDKSGRARRITREMQLFWKKYSKVEKVHRKKAEKHALEQIKLDEEMREAKRQQRKLNFLISQTELFAHFISKKLGKAHDGIENDERIKSILNTLEKDYIDNDSQVSVSEDASFEHDFDDHDGSYYSDKAMKNVKKAIEQQQSQTSTFDSVESETNKFSESYSLMNPSISANEELKQPSLFKGLLKSYQLKGMNWLVNLYEQGINGILADEMGLGKTVQTIAFFGHLAEKINIWGPFLVVAPASTLNNWHQEFTKFFPEFKVLPYWGNPNDRKVLRKFWNQKSSYHSDRNSAPFHILVTSYQLVISDVRYFQRIKWQYMVLDEAQALKSSSSARWKVLLDFNCRNRLLLTGTPIQNTMAELWALLHFIMPSLFDSHSEFNEWFSKDIENHIENKSNIDETQLSRLHMILKPFMLRRIKRDVENELSEKIEVRVHCSLTPRQQSLYNGVKQNIRLEDILKSSGNTYVSSGGTALMNIVMQFRKVCNHPDLFERREITSPLHSDPIPFYFLPRLIYREGILSRISPGRRKLLYCDLNIHHPHNIQQSLFYQNGSSDFSFLRLLCVSHTMYWKVMGSSAKFRWLLNANMLTVKKSIYLKHIFHSDDLLRDAPDDYEKDIKNNFNLKDFLLIDTNFLNWFCPESPFQKLVFTTYCMDGYTHVNKIIKLQSRNGSSDHQNQQSVYQGHQFISMPKLLMSLYFPAITVGVQDIYCCDTNACIELSQPSFGDMMTPLLYGPSVENIEFYSLSQPPNIPNKQTIFWKHANTGSGLVALSPPAGWSNINIPEKEYLVMDSGKLYALDVLLRRLKAEGHRVLIYSQMTRMINILEEYMWYRRHTYIRLDGSSRISERRDMVADFQSRSDIFAFLLSTRAGGLGINLTAADTVIFYDSDWNPTVDQQAMDRAHRLGQTKQVTVYRLVCQGTVDERILQRAEEKNVIQRMVIAGGSFKPDALKPKEVVSLLLDDEQLMQKLKMKRDENRGDILPYKGKKRGRKTNAEREEKRIKLMQEQGVTDPSCNITISHSESNSPSNNLFESKFLTGTLAPADEDSKSSSFFDSAPTSPASGISGNSDQRYQDEDLIIIDDLDSPANIGTPNVRSFRGRGGRGSGRARGRPRIRPLIPEAPKRSYNRSSTTRIGTRSRRASRAKRIFTGRAAAMAGARAGAVAASAATYATYGYGLEPTDNFLHQKDSTISKPSSTT